MITIQDELELTRKLAEWAGFLYKSEPGYHGWYKGFGTTGLEYYGEKPPDFIHSLDACFKGLVPKLRGYHLELNVHISGDKYQFLMMRAPNAAIMNRIGAVAETPALALCLAIKKLINEETKE